MDNHVICVFDDEKTVKAFFKNLTRNEQQRLTEKMIFCGLFMIAGRTIWELWKKNEELRKELEKTKKGV